MPLYCKCAWRDAWAGAEHTKPLLQASHGLVDSPFLSPFFERETFTLHIHATKETTSVKWKAIHSRSFELPSQGKPKAYRKSACHAKAGTCQLFTNSEHVDISVQAVLLNTKMVWCRGTGIVAHHRHEPWQALLGHVVALHYWLILLQCLFFVSFYLGRERYSLHEATITNDIAAMWRSCRQWIKLIG